MKLHSRWDGLQSGILGSRWSHRCPWRLKLSFLSLHLIWFFLRLSQLFVIEIVWLNHIQQMLLFSLAYIGFMKRKHQAVSKINIKQLHQCWSWNQCWSHTVLILEPTCQRCAAGSPPTALDLSYQCPRKSQTSAKPSFSLDFNFETEVLLSPQQSKAFLLNSLRLWVLSNIFLIALIRRWKFFMILIYEYW